MRTEAHIGNVDLWCHKHFQIGIWRFELSEGSGSSIIAMKKGSGI